MFRTDNNHQLIIDVLRGLGVFVRSLAKVGGGIPDLLCAFRGVWYLVEIKNPDRSWKYTPAQKTFLQEAEAKVVTLFSTDDAIAWVQKIAKGGVT